MEPKYSIVRVVFEYPPIIGGSVSHILELSRAIDSHLDKQTIIAPDFPGSASYDHTISTRIIRIRYPRSLSFMDFRLPAPVLLFYARRVAARVRGMLKVGEKIDLVHVHGSMLGALLVFFFKLYGLRIPILVMQHGFGVDRSVGHRLSGLATSLLLWFFRPARFLLLDDGTRIDRIALRLKRRGIPYDVVFHGIDTDFFHPRPDPEPYIQDLVFLFPHRPENVKRPDLALDILNYYGQIAPHQPATMRFLFESKKDLLAKKAAHYHIEDQVVYAGCKSAEGVRSELWSCSTVIGTSLESNMNRAIQEAMACELPVIAFDSGGTSRLLQNQRNGILVPALDIKTFAEGLSLIGNDPDLAKRLGKEARRTIVETRNWRTRIERELNAYTKILSERSR